MQALEPMELDVEYMSAGHFSHFPPAAAWSSR